MGCPTALSDGPKNNWLFLPCFIFKRVRSNQKLIITAIFGMKLHNPHLDRIQNHLRGLWVMNCFPLYSPFRHVGKWSLTYQYFRGRCSNVLHSFATNLDLYGQGSTLLRPQGWIILIPYVFFWYIPRKKKKNSEKLLLRGTDSHRDAFPNATILSSLSLGSVVIYTFIIFTS